MRDNSTPSLDMSIRVFEQFLLNELLKIYENQSHGIVCATTSTLRQFMEKLNSVHYNTCKNQSNEIRELYLLHQIVNSLFYFNDTYLNLSKQEFRSRILFPNLTYILIRFNQVSHGFLKKCIREVYNEIKRKSYGIIQRYSGSYYLDHDIIQSDALYDFLGNALRKFDPLTINNPNAFYKQVFRQIFFYYFKKEENVHSTISSLWDIDISISRLINIPVRLSIYRDVLYSSQIRSYCQQSPTLNILKYNYDIFRNVIINNEFQNMYFSCLKDSVSVNDHHYKLMKLYSDTTDCSDLVGQIKKLPLIFKLLKCVHIVNPKSRPYNEMMIKPQLVKNVVLEELIYPFRNIFNESHIYGILDKIADNFVSNILSGEYINLLTLSQVRITHASFVNQVREFVKICLTYTDIGEEEWIHTDSMI